MCEQCIVNPLSFGDAFWSPLPSGAPQGNVNVLMEP